jgi:hypothetical protein
LLKGEGERVESGEVSFSSLAGGGTTTLNATFNKAYSKTPIVQLTFKDKSGTHLLHVGALAMTSTSFSMNIHNSSATTASGIVMWTSVGK